MRAKKQHIVGLTATRHPEGTWGIDWDRRCACFDTDLAGQWSLLLVVEPPILPQNDVLVCFVCMDTEIKATDHKN